jgi:hypothetical protein
MLNSDRIEVLIAHAQPLVEARPGATMRAGARSIDSSGTSLAPNLMRKMWTSSKANLVSSGPHRREFTTKMASRLAGSPSLAFSLIR